MTKLDMTMDPPFLLDRETMSLVAAANDADEEAEMEKVRAALQQRD
jgi:hypothetical protein